MRIYPPDGISASLKPPIDRLIRRRSDEDFVDPRDRFVEKIQQGLKPLPDKKLRQYGSSWRRNRVE
jgi:hypothetical protein